MIDHVLEKLEASGHRRVVVNVHYMREALIDHLRTWESRIDLRISVEADLLLDTGGGLKQAQGFLETGKPVLLHNADVWSEINFEDLYSEFEREEADALLAVSSRSSSRNLCFHAKSGLSAWRNLKTGEERRIRDLDSEVCYAFSGIHLLGPALLRDFPEDKVFSIVSHYLNLAGRLRIKAFVHSAESWFDLGTVEKLMAAEEYIASLK